MDTPSSYILYTFIFILLTTVSCSDNPTDNESDLEESLEPIEEVIAVSGAENTMITVNKDSTAFFSIEFSKIKSNDVIQNGIKRGWCIDWESYINSNGGVYQDLKLYSTRQVKKWMPVNYLLNIQEGLQSNDPEITYLEIQLAIWSLRGNPEFNLDEVDIMRLPNRFRKNGEPIFNYQKVKEVLKVVEDGYRSFEFSAESKFAVIAATPDTVQTVFGVVE